MPWTLPWILLHDYLGFVWVIEKFKTPVDLIFFIDKVIQQLKCIGTLNFGFGNQFILPVIIFLDSQY